MESRPQLVLDLAGVLIENFSVYCWRELSENAETTFEEFAERFRTIRADLWTGTMTEDRFWEWAQRRYPSLNRDRGRAVLRRHLQPLPGFGCLERWSGSADIHVLSNHCREWLEPILSEIESVTHSITISNQTGYRKPDPRIYDLVSRRFGARAGSVLYVDDQEKNLVPARDRGWATLLADERGEWIRRVEDWLEGTQRSYIGEEAT